MWCFCSMHVLILQLLCAIPADSYDKPSGILGSHKWSFNGSCEETNFNNQNFGTSNGFFIWTFMAFLPWKIGNFYLPVIINFGKVHFIWLAWLSMVIRSFSNSMERTYIFQYSYIKNLRKIQWLWHIFYSISITWLMSIF